MELQVIEQDAIAVAFQTKNGIQSLFDRMAEQARSIVPDVSTKKGREAIASQAYKVSKSKTAVDNHGKELVAGIKAQAAVIDKDRKAWRDQCDALRDEIRKPLDDWEQAEKDRVAKHEDAIQFIKDRASAVDATALKLKGDIAFLENLNIDSRYEEYEEQAKLAKLETLELLRSALVTREKYEAEQAELERLRQAEQARLQQERDAKIAHEAAEKATREAEEKARFEAERVQREKAEAEQREARLKAEKEAAELRAVQAAENERKRIESEQAAKAEAERKAEEVRLADIEHRRQINREALEAIKGVCPDLTEPQIKALVGAIISGLIPHVSIKY